MKPIRLFAIILIYVATSIAWMILAGATNYRSENTYNDLLTGSREGAEGRASIQQLWGSPQVQLAPKVWTSHIEKTKTTNSKGKVVWQENQVTDPVVLSQSRLNVGFDLEPRQKGLLWYATYKLKFSGEYKFINEFSGDRHFAVKFPFPDSQTAYNNVIMRMNGKRVQPGGDLSQGMITHLDLKPGETADFQVSYGSQGLDTWHYKFNEDGSVSSVRNFEANVTTNTKEIDFPENCISPTHKAFTANGYNLTWKYGDLISGANLGISMPHKLNPGPFASRLSFFAPVSLLFFFAVLLIVGAVKRIKLHPMHYVMLAAAFFAFHLLFSYLVDHVSPFSAFLVSSAVSMILTISYLRLAVDWKFALFTGGLWQFVFLVLFAYAFFFEGYTGLTITIGAIVTLAALMQMTGRVNWEEALSGNNGTKPPTPPAPAETL
jgi:inner membrane protein involved in colicin E2 resistance